MARRTALQRRLPVPSARVGAVAVAVVLLVATFVLVRQGGPEQRTVTAHLPRAVSIYPGTDVRILGVSVGKVTRVVPEGQSVRVEIEYDAEYVVPEDVEALVIQPTLVADRFVQLSPAYTSGPVLPDGGDIPLPATAVPVELDRVYASLEDLSRALGPQGANADGTLDQLLGSTARALSGQGANGNVMIRNLSEAMQTLGGGSEDLFATVTQLAQFSSTLAANDTTVRTFIRDLAAVSSQLSGDRQELRRALRSVAGAVGMVQSFVKENRKALVTDVERLTRTVKTISSESSSVDTVLSSAAVSLGNLGISLNNETNTVGSRFGFGQNVWDGDGFLCALVQQSQMAQAQKDLACTIFEKLLEPLEDQVPDVPPASRSTTTSSAGPADGGAGPADGTRSRTRVQVPGTLSGDEQLDFDQLLGGVS